MRHAAKRAVEPGECESGLEQRNIECGTVIGDDKIEAPEQLAERVQHGGLFVEVADEILEQVELVAREVADPDQERTHTRSALQACRLSVQEYNPLARGNSRFLRDLAMHPLRLG